MPARRDDQAASDLPTALHEVGNALTVVVGWIDLAIEALPPGAPATEALEVARGRAVRAQRLARRAIGAEREADPPRLLGAVVREVVQGLHGARARTVRVTMAISEQLACANLVRGDAAGQVLTNLVLNAVEVSQADGAVCVEAREDGEGSVVFTVRDEGPGVPEELRDALFTSGRSSRPGGAGIGLRHAAMLAVEVGGVIVLGQGEGPGAVFEVRWPLAAAPDRDALDAPLDETDEPFERDAPSVRSARLASLAPASAPSSPTRCRLDGLRLLLVEDDPAVVDLLEVALAARGATVETVVDRTGLRNAFAQAPFDAALLDLSPLGDDVAAMLGALRAHSAGARLVVISGSVAFSRDVPHVDAWVRKPFEVEDVLRALSTPTPPPL